MKYGFSLIIILLAATVGYGQENLGILQAGYSAGNGSSAPTGFKINAAWEFQPNAEKWTMGGSLGYIRLTGKETAADFSVSSVPVTFVSRIMFGGESFKFFVRGQLGTHISTISYSGALVSSSDTQVGMAAGLSGGVMYFASEKMFLSADYEWLWLTNAYANTGSIGTAALGLGFKF